MVTSVDGRKYIFLWGNELFAKGVDCWCKPVWANFEQNSDMRDQTSDILLTGRIMKHTALDKTIQIYYFKIIFSPAKPSNWFQNLVRHAKIKCWPGLRILVLDSGRKRSSTNCSFDVRLHLPKQRLCVLVFMDVKGGFTRCSSDFVFPPVHIGSISYLGVI